MPDWMSHIIIGLILAELFNVRKKSLVLLGALLPDILSKYYIALFYLGIRSPISFFYFHTFALSFLSTILIALLFRHDRIKTILLLNLGVISHLLADLTVRHFVEEITLFFPFHIRFKAVGWIWPEQSIYVLIVSLFIYILVRFVNRSYISQKNV